MANVSRKLLEDAIIARLVAGMTTAFAVERFSGQAGNPDELLKWIKELPSLPAVAVFYSGGQNDTVGDFGEMLTKRVTYDLWLVHEKLRGYEQAMIDDNGIYEMLEEIDAALQGKVVLAGTKRMRVLDDQMLGAEFGNRVVWVVRVETEFTNSY